MGTTGEGNRYYVKRVKTEFFSTCVYEFDLVFLLPLSLKSRKMR